MPWAQRPDFDLTAAHRAEMRWGDREGDPETHVAYNWYWDDLGGSEPFDPDVHPGLVFTGKAAGTVLLEDGTAINVTPDPIEVHRDHHAELLGHIDAMHRQSGYLPAED